MAGLLDVLCALLLIQISHQSCDNTYGTDIDFDQAYLEPVVTNCTERMTVTFNDGSDSKDCHKFFKPFLRDSYYVEKWMPANHQEHPALTLTFEEPVFISSLRLLDSHYFAEEPPTKDMVTFITFAQGTEKKKFTWSKTDMVKVNYFHVLHFQTVWTNQLIIEFIPEKNAIWLAYLEVNRLKESVRRNMLDLSHANISCSPDSESHCATIYDGNYTDLDKSWRGSPTEHYSTVTIDLAHIYQLQMARIFLSSFQCTNVMMNVSVICNGHERVFGNKSYNFSGLSFIVFPMYNLKTDSFSVKFDCYRGNGLPSTIKVVEVEFYGSEVFPTTTSTALTSETIAPTTSLESTTETFAPAAQSIGGKLKVTSEDYTPKLAHTNSEAYKAKKTTYGNILLQSYQNVITSTNRIYNLTFTKGSIATNYVADTLEPVTLTDGVKQQLADSIVNTFQRNNITVDPSSIDFTDLFGTTTAAATKSTPESEILAGVLGAVATLLVIALVIAGVTVRMCLRSQRDAARGHDRELNNNNGANPFQFPPMFGSSQTSSNHSYPAFFSSSVRNHGLSYRRPLHPHPPEPAVFDFPTAPTPFQHPPTSGAPSSSFARDRNEERMPPSRGDYLESQDDVARFQQSRRKRKKSQEYVERSDATSLTGYTPRRTDVPSTKPSRNVFERAALESEDEAYFTSDINYPHDGLHRSNSINLHRNRAYDNSYDTDYSQEEVEEVESRFHRSGFRPEPVRRSGRGADDRHLGEGPSSGYFHDEQDPHSSPQFHRDSLRVKRGRQLQRNLSHESEARDTSGYYHRSRPGPYTRDYYNPADDGVDSDALRPYYLAPEHNKPKGFFGRLSKKLSAPRVKKSGQNVHRQPPAYEREHKFSNA